MKQRRSLDLIANFVNGYADGWYFAIRECFKDALDIKYTTRQESSSEKSKTVMRWTQGNFYSFAEGHIIYDTPKAYLQWNEALKYIKFVCSVICATPAGIDNNNCFTKGSVTFSLSKPNSKKDGLDIIGQYHLDQKEFVNFLKRGDSGVYQKDENCC